MLFKLALSTKPYKSNNDQKAIKELEKGDNKLLIHED